MKVRKRIRINNVEKVEDYLKENLICIDLERNAGNVNLRDYKNVLLEDKIVNWSDLTPLERLIAYRNSGRNTPHCDCCEEVMHQYEKYAWCKRNGLKLSKKETDYGVINELRNVDGLAMKGDTMTSPWTIIKEFAKFDSQSENPDFFKNEFKDWCDRTNKAYREGTLTYLQKLLFQFISLAHTPGNFCIVPEMFNVGRSGPFAVNDKWDLTLNTIEKWYESRDDEVLKNMMQSKYKDMQLKKAIKFATNWLESFSDFEEFCECNYFQDYLEEGKLSAWSLCICLFRDTKKKTYQGSEWKYKELLWGEFLWTLNHRIISRNVRLADVNIIDKISNDKSTNLYAEQIEEALYRLKNYTDFSDLNLYLQKLDLISRQGKL